MRMLAAGRTRRGAAIAPSIRLMFWQREAQTAREAAGTQRSGSSGSGALAVRSGGPRSGGDLQKILGVIDLFGVEEAVKLPDSGRVTHLAEGLGLDLADALASDLELFAKNLPPR